MHIKPIYRNLSTAKGLIFQDGWTCSECNHRWWPVHVGSNESCFPYKHNCTHKPARVDANPPIGAITKRAEERALPGVLPDDGWDL